jgi:pimeloyl-ACP methyl ester carboxylesterase
MLILLSALLACLLGLAGVLVCWSYPGRPRPFVDERGRTLPGSIAEKIRVGINGVEQGMIIKGKDRTKPVLLYLHGGMPEYFLTQRYPTGLEDHFTVCWWEQRGAGLSYSPGIPRATLTAAQLISDTLAVTDYLRRRFDQDRIYLMAHSGGTFLGIQAAARAPDRYRAYVGVAQISSQLRSEKRAYDSMLQQLKARGDTRLVRKLEAAPVTLADGVPSAYLAVRDEAMHRLGVGTMRGMKSVVGGLFLPSLQSREYTLGEKLNLWRGKAASGVSSTWREMLATDLATRVPEVGVPVFFFHGVHDYTCSYAEAEAYFEQLEAPIKGFYAFAQSAHSPIFEEPARAQRILREDVLAGANGLADRR